MGYGVFERNGAPPEYWLKVPLGAGWTAAYRLSYHGSGSARRVRIEELRIVPVRSADFYPDVRVRGTVTDAPFRFDAVRREITARRFTDAVAALGSFLPEDSVPGEWGDPVAARLQTARPRSRKGGRPVTRPLVHYARFAVRYDYAENQRRRERGDSTRAWLARHYGVPETTIGKWIRVARLHGFLTSARRGQRGGFVTLPAKQLLKGGQ